MFEWIIKINVLGKVKCILCIKILLYGLNGKSVLFEYCNLESYMKCVRSVMMNFMFLGV